jgi:hypothetical protein
MSAYARKLRTVPNDIIGEVAQRFRLNPGTETPKSRITRSSQDEFLQSRSSPTDATAEVPAAESATSEQEQFFEERIANRTRYR